MARTKKKPEIPKLEETDNVRKIREFCKELRTKGWTTITMTYQGSGDSCEDFNFSLDNEEDSFDLSLVPAAQMPTDFNTAALERALWDLLPEGFENNEGGDGVVTIDIGTGSIHVKHSDYYIESHTAEWGYE